MSRSISTLVRRLCADPRLTLYPPPVSPRRKQLSDRLTRAAFVAIDHLPHATCRTEAQAALVELMLLANDLYALLAREAEGGAL